MFLKTSYVLEMILYMCVKAGKVCFNIAALQIRNLGLKPLK